MPSIPWFTGTPYTYNAAIEKGRRQMELAQTAGVVGGSLLGAYRRKVKEGQQVDDQLTKLQQASGVQLGSQVLNADENTDVPGTRAGETQGKEREDVPPSGAQGEGPQSSTTSYVKSGALGSQEFGQGPEQPSKLMEALRFAGGPFIGTETQAMRGKKQRAAGLEGVLEHQKGERATLGSLSNMLTQSADPAGTLAQVYPDLFGYLKPGSIQMRAKGETGKLNEWEIRAAAARGEPWAVKAIKDLEASRMARTQAGGAAGRPEPPDQFLWNKATAVVQAAQARRKAMGQPVREGDLTPEIAKVYEHMKRNQQLGSEVGANTLKSGGVTPFPADDPNLLYPGDEPIDDGKGP